MARVPLSIGQSCFGELTLRDRSVPECASHAAAVTHPVGGARFLGVTTDEPILVAESQRMVDCSKSDGLWPSPALSRSLDAPERLDVRHRLLGGASEEDGSFPMSTPTHYLTHLPKPAQLLRRAPALSLRNEHLRGGAAAMERV